LVSVSTRSFLVILDPPVRTLKQLNALCLVAAFRKVPKIFNTKKAKRQQEKIFGTFRMADGFQKYLIKIKQLHAKTIFI
jgi:hypothetical protein